MYPYPFSKLTGANFFLLQGMSLQMLESASRVNDAEGEEISPAPKGAVNFASSFGAPRSQRIISKLARRFLNLAKFKALVTRTRV